MKLRLALLSDVIGILIVIVSNLYTAIKWWHMLARLWSKGNTPPLLVRVQTCTTTLKIKMAVPQKVGSWSTSRSSYTTLGHTPQRLFYYRDTCSSMFTAALFIIVRDRKQPRCPSKGEWLMRMWYIYTMEYYSAVKRWTSQVHWWSQKKKNIHSELSQTPKDKHHMFSLIGGS